MALTKIDDRGLKTPIDLLDNEKIRLGTGNDLQIYHDGSNGTLVNSTGYVHIRASSSQVYIDGTTVNLRNHAGSQTFVKGSANGAVELFYAGSKKLETTSAGVTLTGSLQLGGTLDTNNHNIHFNDNVSARFGTGQDFDIYHNGTDSYINSSTGDLYIRTTGSGSDDIFIIANDDVDIKTNSGDLSIKAVGGAGTKLYYNGSQKLETHASGTHLTGGSSNVSINLKTSDGTTRGSLFANNSNIIGFLGNNGSWALSVENAGGNTVSYNHFNPSTNNTLDLGTSSARWRNIYTNDLNLSNEGHSNDVDGSWGNWTIQEGESDLFLKNNRSGKQYKFNLTEVS